MMPTEQWVTNKIEAMEQAHAELAAKVDALNPNDEGMHTLPAKTAAQERYHEANEHHYSNREVEMAAGAFDRAEEVAQELDDWTHLIHMRLNTMSQRIASLESPAPAPDPVCQCGFPYDGKCMRRDCPGVGSECANCGHQLVDGSCVNCSYVPAEQPALDPGFRIAIREAVVRMAALNVTVQEVDDITDAVIHTMRTYGRDGAR